MSITRKLLAVSIAAIGQQAFAAGAPEAPAADPGIAEQSVVVVTASLRNHTAASAPAFTTIVTEEDIARSPVNSLPDLLRDTVGVNNMTDSTGRDEIQIRGLGGKYTLMLVNGKRVSSGGALWRGGDFDFSSIALSSIKRVEIVRGPMAALYGSDAIGGVVNIITKAPTREWKGSVSGEYRVVQPGDEGDQYRVGASIAGALNDTFGLSLSGEYYDRDPWYAISASDTTRPARLEEKRAANVAGTLSVKLAENQSLDIDASLNRDHRPRALFYYDYNAEWDWTTRDYREQEIERGTIGATHKADWGWGNTTAFITREHARIDDFNSRYDAPQQRVLYEDNTYAKAYANVTRGIHAVTAGIDLRRQVIKDNATYRDSGRISTDSKAVFLEDELTLTPALHLTLAGRVDDSNTFGSHFSPKSYLVWQGANGLTVKGGISRAFKAPEAYQLSTEYRTVSCGGKCSLSGNPDLTPETSTNYEAGFEIHRAGWDFTAVVFKNDVDDMIVATYDPAGPSRAWVNVAKARTRGIELQGEARLSPAFSISANMTHLNADYIDETGKEAKLDNRPENVAMASLNWKIDERFSTALSAHYTGKQYYLTKDLPGYTRTDLSFAAKVNKQLTIRAGVKNLTDVDLEKKSRDFDFFELGRNYYVSATYNF
ncbi:TonB-dependent receptor plug domain-containing protein [Pseudoduganella plicata]|uniref:TonB-dependent receptor n=1 Tax=Pseudoduganella plicata TaxID=321984 RepID=A0A4P7BBU8_9BURK|nr:TonB-dependent receptor [Pseudoduganella plicata]QBQ34905.1 TonB-dependent receptor [Pseudoduganella plicata]GGY89488.1 TonB-dependent receptor [Pseudoduganella plicata]